MNISTHITKLAKTAVAALALVALASSATLAAGASGDDWYRDATAMTIDQSPAVGDAWYRDGSAAAVEQPVLTGDSWYRDTLVATSVSSPTSIPVSSGPQASPGGFDWGDFGIGAASMVGALGLLALLAIVGRTRLGGGPTLGRTS